MLKNIRSFCSLAVLMISLFFFNFVFSGFAFAEGFDSTTPMTVNEKAQAQLFSYYNNTLEKVLKVYLGDANYSQDEDVQKLMDAIGTCTATEQVDGQLITLEGEKCGIYLEINRVSHDLGNNENGDPVYEVSTEESFRMIDQNLVDNLDIVSFHSVRLDHYDTLVSTPATVRVSNLAVTYETANGHKVSTNAHMRLYTSMETQEHTYYRTQEFKFYNFATKFNVTAELGAEGTIKALGSDINEQKVTLSELLEVFKPAFVGLDNGKAN